MAFCWQNFDHDFMPINNSIVCLGAQEKSSQLVAVLGVYSEEHRIHLFDAGTVV